MILMLRAGLTMAALALCSCGTANVSYDAYQGSSKADAEVAVVAERDAIAGLSSITKDGASIWRRKANYAEQWVKGNVTVERVKLEPGRYTIQSLLWCASSYAYGMSGYKSPYFLGIRHIDEVELLPGHAYEIQGENVGYLCHDGAKLWIEDKTAGMALKVISSNEQTFQR